MVVRRGVDVVYAVLVAVGVSLWFVTDRVGKLYQWLTRVKARYLRFLDSVYEWTL
jgi:uncharacterized protein YggT (Ycf19 family)